MSVTMSDINMTRQTMFTKLMGILDSVEGPSSEKTKFADSMSRVMSLTQHAIEEANKTLAADGKMISEKGISFVLTDVIEKFEKNRPDSIFYTPDT